MPRKILTYSSETDLFVLKFTVREGECFILKKSPQNITVQKAFLCFAVSCSKLLF